MQVVMCTGNLGCVFYYLALICDPDHLCFRWTTYDDINGLGGTIYVVIFGPAGPLMYPDQISHYSCLHYSVLQKRRHKIFSENFLLIVQLIVEIQQSQSYHKWLGNRLNLLVKVEMRYCGIKKGLMKVIIFYHAMCIYFSRSYCYKKSMEFDTYLAFSILHQG